jgi:hypothetical protein
MMYDIHYIVAHEWESAMDPIPFEGFEGARMSHITDYTYPRVLLGAVHWAHQYLRWLMD